MAFNKRKPQANRRAAFTLVELLVVVVIIIILAGLTVPVVLGVIATVNQTRIGAEIAQLQMAIEDYATKNGDHPPDFSDAAVVRQHLSKAFPNNKETNATITNLVGQLDADEALVFVLSGIKNDPVFPLSGGGAALKGYEFREERFVDPDGDGFRSYNAAAGIPAPYLYFDSRNPAPTFAAANGTTFTAYSVGTTYKPYQIVSAGLDGDFGTGGVGTAGPFPPVEQDNLANFTEGKTLEDNIPD
jgi:type II secretory pathway pseudopilin PulG